MGKQRKNPPCPFFLRILDVNIPCKDKSVE